MLQITDGSSCNEDNHFSMTLCLQEFVVSETGCAIDWFRNTTFRRCSTFEEFEAVQGVWNWLFDATYDDIVARTGCLQKCSYNKYEVVDLQTEEISWNTTEWLSEFYVYTDSDHVTEREVSFNSMSFIKQEFLNICFYRS